VLYVPRQQRLEILDAVGIGNLLSAPCTPLAGAARDLARIGPTAELPALPPRPVEIWSSGSRLTIGDDHFREASTKNMMRPLAWVLAIDGMACAALVAARVFEAPAVGAAIAGVIAPAILIAFYEVLRALDEPVDDLTRRTLYAALALLLVPVLVLLEPQEGSPPHQRWGVGRGSRPLSFVEARHPRGTDGTA
jgi:hypothetical protein